MSGKENMNSNESDLFKLAKNIVRARKMSKIESLRDELAKTYPEYYEIVHMNADTPRLSGSEYLVHGYKAGFDESSGHWKRMADKMNKSLEIILSQTFNGNWNAQALFVQKILFEYKEFLGVSDE